MMRGFYRRLRREGKIGGLIVSRGWEVKAGG